MTRDEILAFLNANQLSFLATVDGDTPRVRGMMHVRADKNGILYHTGKGKDMVEQMLRNPHVELCVFNPEQQIQVRVTGVVEFIDDLELKKQLVAERPFLQSIVDQTGYEAFLVFRVKDCVATVWTMATNMEPKTFVKLT